MIGDQILSGLKATGNFQSREYPCFGINQRCPGHGDLITPVREIVTCFGKRLF
jgi:hypothetical protein